MKKTLLVLLSLVHMPWCVCAAVSVQVFERDGVTPFDGRPLMVGSELSIVVSGDAGAYWGGGLFVAGADRGLARLSARGYDPNTYDWSGSRYPAAGPDARVFGWANQDKWGFDLYTGGIDEQPGPWFVVDYRAIACGEPNVWVCDYSNSFEEPNEVIYFSQVRSRDFNGDGVVNTADYALLASRWRMNNSGDSNTSDQVDMNADGSVDVLDLAMFADFWLWGVPHKPVSDPDVTFRIVDAEGLHEITLAVGEQITLYVAMETLGTPVQVFEVEADISNVALGAIDNTPYDQTNPPGTGTARILAQPRDTFFDMWGPGEIQAEGIILSGVSLLSPMGNGWLASFVYTSLKAGDVKLNPVDLLDSYDVRLEPITIHQVDGIVQATFDAALPTVSSRMTLPYELSVDEMVSKLEEIYRTERQLRAEVPEDQWLNFINDVKESGSVDQ